MTKTEFSKQSRLKRSGFKLDKRQRLQCSRSDNINSMNASFKSKPSSTERNRVEKTERNFSCSFKYLSNHPMTFDLDK